MLARWIRRLIRAPLVVLMAVGAAFGPPKPPLPEREVPAQVAQADDDAHR